MMKGDKKQHVPAFYGPGQFPCKILFRTLIGTVPWCYFRIPHGIVIMMNGHGTCKSGSRTFKCFGPLISVELFPPKHLCNILIAYFILIPKAIPVQFPGIACGIVQVLAIPLNTIPGIGMIRTHCNRSPVGINSKFRVKEKLRALGKLTERLPGLLVRKFLSLLFRTARAGP